MLHYFCRTFLREDAQRVGLSRDPKHAIVVHGAASRELPAPINTRTQPPVHILDQCNLRLCNCCMHVREFCVCENLTPPLFFNEIRTTKENDFKLTYLSIAKCCGLFSSK